MQLHLYQVIDPGKTIFSTTTLTRGQKFFLNLLKADKSQKQFIFLTKQKCQFFCWFHEDRRNMNVNELFLDQIWMKITGTGEKSLIVQFLECQSWIKFNWFEQTILSLEMGKRMLKRKFGLQFMTMAIFKIVRETLKWSLPIRYHLRIFQQLPHQTLG